MPMRGRSSSRARAPHDDQTWRGNGGVAAGDFPPGNAGGRTSIADPSSPGASAGTAGRRRGLPNARALAGAFFIAVAAVLVLASWLSVTRTHRRAWVVATHPLAAGTTLSAQDLRTASMQLPGVTAGQAFADPSALLGRTLAAPIASGGLIQAGSLVQRGQQPALRPVSVSDSEVDLATMAAGDAVDVLVTEGSDTSAITSTVVRNAQVISVSRPSSSSVVGGSTDGVITIGVRNLAEAEAVVQASHAGSVTVILAERSDGTGLGGAHVGDVNGTGSQGATSGAGVGAG
ncbi:MAG: flagella basal body P-ring formation protein FlgA [Acidimicrobiaceae bacterium]|nr:flagella basal body P-ring formation protein FlgA [Acidimicrobiaceae bacterium]